MDAPSSISSNAGTLGHRLTQQQLNIMKHDRYGQSRFVRVGMLVAGVTSVGGLFAMIAIAIGKVRSGHGLDTYRTFWLVEFNWVSFLVFLGALVAALIIAVGLRHLDSREIRELEKKYGTTNDDV